MLLQEIKIRQVFVFWAIIIDLILDDFVKLLPKLPDVLLLAN